VARITRNIQDASVTVAALLCVLPASARGLACKSKGAEKHPFVTSELSNGANPEFSKFPGECTFCGIKAAVCRAHDRMVWA
jgi:hypothetical protein